MLPEYMTVIERIKYFAEEEPHKDSYIFIGQSNAKFILSRHDLWELPGRFASKLKHYGVQKGEIICNTLPNSRSRLVTDIGILMAGAVTSNGMVLMKSGEDLKRNIRRTKCRYIIGPSSGSVYDVFQSNLKPVHDFIGKCAAYKVHCMDCPHLQYYLMLDIHCHGDHTSFLNGLQQEAFYQCPVQPDDEAYMFTTSGTSGVSKFVPRCQRELVKLGENLKPINCECEVMYCDNLMGWVGGFPHSYFYSGVTMCCQELWPGVGKRKTSEIWEFLLDNNVSVAMMLPLEVFEVLEDVVKTGFSGQSLVPGVELVIRDENTGIEITESFKQGKLYFKGGTVMRGYFNKDDETLSAMSTDGWYDSSDVGYIDSEGNVYVVGRTCDSIELGHIILYPQFVEEVLNSCPGVALVAVVGIPHPETIEELCVCVLCRRDSTVTEEQLSAFYDEKFAVSEIKPKRYIFVESLPVNINGKIQRKELQLMAAKYFGIQDNKPF